MTLARGIDVDICVEECSLLHANSIPVTMLSSNVFARSGLECAPTRRLGGFDAFQQTQCRNKRSRTAPCGGTLTVSGSESKLPKSFALQTS